MKIRMRGNSIRFRLTQTEVADFGKDGICANKIEFPNGKILTYQITKAEKLGANFTNDIINIILPEIETKSWVNTDKVGIKGDIALENENTLNILVEKDFKCLTKRAEDESDMFPNPNERH